MTTLVTRDKKPAGGIVQIFHSEPAALPVRFRGLGILKAAQPTYRGAILIVETFPFVVVQCTMCISALVINLILRNMVFTGDNTHSKDRVHFH